MIYCHQLPATVRAPIVIGASGGSGTRCVGVILRDSCCFIGSNLNDSLDSLDLVPFFRSFAKDVYFSAQKSDAPVEDVHVETFQQAIAAHLQNYNRQSLWGWKNPQSMLLLPVLDKLLPAMRFVHVVRDGRDMALSVNQNQYRAVHTDYSQAVSAEELSKFWSESNLFAARYGRKNLQNRYHLIRFEDMCADPVGTIQALFDFIGHGGDAAAMSAHVRPPTSLGRHCNLPADERRSLTDAARPGLVAFGYLQNVQK